MFNLFKSAEKQMAPQEGHTWPSIAVTTFRAPYIKGGNIPLLYLVYFGLVLRAEKEIICCLYNVHFRPYTNHCENNSTQRTEWEEISFPTMLFSKHLDHIRLRYRHSKTVDFWFLAWTLVY